MNAKPASQSRRLARRVWQHMGLYMLLMPALILVILFAYKPMYGIVIAFKDYKNTLGIMGSPWAQPLSKYFDMFFNSYQFVPTVRNTLVISFYSLLAGFPFPIIVALTLNQMRSAKFKRVYQTISYLPHFISTVVMVGIILILLSPGNGLWGNLFKLFGKQAPNIMGDKNLFSSIYVWTDVWQHTGWNSIIYFAALSAIDPSLYEAATVDGASRFQKIKSIDIPMLLPTASILLIMSAGNIMNVGFEKVYLMQNNLNTPVSEVLSTYTYKIGITKTQYSYSSAINLFNTMVNLALLITVNFFSKRFSQNSLW